jgi:hypothetical protein
LTSLILRYAQSFKSFVTEVVNILVFNAQHRENNDAVPGLGFEMSQPVL